MKIRKKVTGLNFRISRNKYVERKKITIYINEINLGERKMKKYLQSIFISLSAILVIGMLVTSCQNADQTVYKANVGGFVIDSATGLPLQNAQVVCNTFSVLTYTDSVGHFYFADMQMPRGEWSAYFTASSYGYTSKTIYSYIVSYHLNDIGTIMLVHSLKK